MEPINNVVEFVSVYDEDNDGSLTQMELNVIQSDLEYSFTANEIDRFKLDQETIPLKNVIDAINYIHSNETTYDDFKNELLKSQQDDGDNGKIFIPHLLNILKANPQWNSKDKLMELMCNLDIDLNEHIIKINDI
jgi:Ca2+-binding EF-hand superfamily protein